MGEKEENRPDNTFHRPPENVETLRKIPALFRIRRQEGDTKRHDPGDRRRKKERENK